MNMGQLVEQGSEEVFPLGFEPTSIGRHGDNEIILPDSQVSRHHAEIVMQGGRWLIADLGSANGTYVNDDLVDALLVYSLHEPLQRRTFQVSARDPAVVKAVRQHLPAFVLLASDVGLTSLPLGIE